MTRRLILALILVVYFVLGALFAVRTPAWQAPDEPAHYNYVAYVAESGAFPVLHFGDYPSEYLEQIKTAKFPPDMPIASIRYESHQPPLYYVLAAGAYSLARGSLLALRLLSVVLGAGSCCLAMRLPGAPCPAMRGSRSGPRPSSRSCPNTWRPSARWETTCWPSCCLRQFCSSPWACCLTARPGRGQTRLRGRGQTRFCGRTTRFDLSLLRCAGRAARADPGDEDDGVRGRAAGAGHGGLALAAGEAAVRAHRARSRGRDLARRADRTSLVCAGCLRLRLAGFPGSDPP